MKKYATNLATADGQNKTMMSNKKTKKMNFEKKLKKIFFEKKILFFFFENRIFEKKNMFQLIWPRSGWDSYARDTYENEFKPGER